MTNSVHPEYPVVPGNPRSAPQHPGTQGNAIPPPHPSLPPTYPTQAPHYQVPLQASPYATPPVHQGPAVYYPPVAPPRPKPVLAWIIMGAGFALVLAAFMPWISVTAPLLGTMTRAGTDGGGDGWIVVGLGIVVIVAGALMQRNDTAIIKVLAAVLGVGAGGVGILDLVEVNRRAAEARDAFTADGDDPFGIGSAFASATSINPGFGLYLTVGAGLAAAITAFVALAKR